MKVCTDHAKRQIGIGSKQQHEQPGKQQDTGQVEVRCRQAVDTAAARDAGRHLLRQVKIDLREPRRVEAVTRCHLAAILRQAGRVHDQPGIAQARGRLREAEEYWAALGYGHWVVTERGTGALVGGNTVSVTFPTGFVLPGSPTITPLTGFTNCSLTGSISGQTVTITLVDETELKAERLLGVAAGSTADVEGSGP